MEANIQRSKDVRSLIDRRRISDWENSKLRRARQNQIHRQLGKSNFSLDPILVGFVWSNHATYKLFGPDLNHISDLLWAYVVGAQAQAT